MREKIREAIASALRSLGGVGEVTFVVERPANMAHGDYSTNAALVAKLDPKELVAKLGTIDGVEKVEVVGRFINFFLAKEELAPQERAVPQTHAGKKILVEYTDPNPFKEFHIGHLMSNAIGESIARLYEATGAQVARANYQGDVGPHVAKALWGLMEHKLDATKIEDMGKAYVAGATAYEENPAAKTEIDGINKRVYDNDPALRQLYEQGRATSLEHFEEIYKTLGTKFDHYFFESETGPLGLALIQKYKQLFEESEGALVYRGAHTRVFITSKGTPTYEAKELGLAELKQQKAPADLYVTVTANEQNGFFAVVFDVVQKIFPALAGKYVHVSHGMMKFVGGKMSSRKGNVITGESLVHDLTEAARGRGDVAVGAIKYAVLKSGSGKDIVFDPAKSLSLEGDSGPYVQYALVRARSLLRKAKDAKRVSVTEGVDHAPDVPLGRILIHYPDVVARAAREMEPHHVVTYITELAGAFNSWYAKQKVIVNGQILGVHQDLVTAVEKTLAEGLQVLGIPTPEEM